MYNAHHSYCDIQISHMEECGNFEMSTTGPNMIKARDGLATPRSKYLSVALLQPLVIGRSRVRCESPQAPQKHIPRF